MNIERRIKILEHEIEYYSRVYPKSSRLKNLLKELHELIKGKYE